MTILCTVAKPKCPKQRDLQHNQPSDRQRIRWLSSEFRHGSDRGLHASCMANGSSVSNSSFIAHAIGPLCFQLLLRCCRHCLPKLCESPMHNAWEEIYRCRFMGIIQLVMASAGQQQWPVRACSRRRQRAVLFSRVFGRQLVRRTTSGFLKLSSQPSISTALQ